MRARHLLAGAFAAVLVFGVSATAASAETVKFHQETAAFGDYVPCVSDFPSLEGFELTTTVNGVEHELRARLERFDERMKSVVPPRADSKERLEAGGDGESRDKGGSS